MEEQENKKLLFIILILTCSYILYFIAIVNIAYKNNFLIPLHEVNLANISCKSFFDILTLYLPVLIFFLFLKKVHSYEKVNKLSVILLLIYIFLFMFIRDLTIRGGYIFLFCFGVGFSEEMIFRQYLYNSLKVSVKPIMAAVFSGGIWGVMHGILPSITGQYPAWNIILFLKEGIIGILVGLIYIYIMKKTKSIWNCIFLHAIFNYFVYIVNIFRSLAPVL